MHLYCCMCVCVHVCACACACTCACACACACVCVRVYVYVLTYTHMKICVYTHVVHQTASGRIVLICARACACACSGWQRLIGYLKLQVIFSKRATNYRAPFRKMTYKDKASYRSWPPCITQAVCTWSMCAFVYERVCVYKRECVYEERVCL